MENRVVSQKIQPTPEIHYWLQLEIDPAVILKPNFGHGRVPIRSADFPKPICPADHETGGSSKTSQGRRVQHRKEGPGKEQAKFTYRAGI